MDIRTDRQHSDDSQPTKDELMRKYGGLFTSDMTFRERLALVRAGLSDRFMGYPDDHFLGEDVTTLTRDFMSHFMEDDPTPNLRFDGSAPTQETSDSDYVVVKYLIPVDRNTDVLNFALPRSLIAGLSEYARIVPKSGYVGYAPLPENIRYWLELEYKFPVDVWRTQMKGRLRSQLEYDLEWLRSVFEDFHNAFRKHTKEMTKLIHIETSNRWQHAMDVASELVHAPLPEEDSEKTVEERKSARYRVHKPYLFGQQKGICNGCRRKFCFDHMEVDHILARSKDGGHQSANLQLLCQPCNNLKDDDSHEDLLARLAVQGPTNSPCSNC